MKDYTEYVGCAVCKRKKQYRKIESGGSTGIIGGDVLFVFGEIFYCINTMVLSIVLVGCWVVWFDD